MKTWATTEQRAPLAKHLCIGILMLGLAGCNDEIGVYPKAGDAFPVDALGDTRSIDGDPLDLRGKTLLINFWATWCAPCREEMPLLQDLSDSLDPERFRVIGISVDEDTNLIREFLLQYGIRFQNLQDREFRLASSLLGIETYPQTYIVSRDGIITERIGEVITQREEVSRRLREADSGMAKQ